MQLLTAAIRNGNVGMVQDLLPQPSGLLGFGLLEAVCSGHRDILELLLDAAAGAGGGGSRHAPQAPTAWAAEWRREEAAERAARVSRPAPAGGCEDCCCAAVKQAARLAAGEAACGRPLRCWSRLAAARS